MFNSGISKALEIHTAAWSVKHCKHRQFLCCETVSRKNRKKNAKKRVNIETQVPTSDKVDYGEHMRDGINKIPASRSTHGVGETHYCHEEVPFNKHEGDVYIHCIA